MVQTELQQIIMNIHRDNIQKIVVAAVVLINNAPLLLKRTTNDFMGGLVELPSGTVEKNETILNALYREIKEETGLQILSVEKILGTFDYVSQSGKKTRQINFKVLTNNTPIQLSAEHCAFYTYTIDNPIFSTLNISPETQKIISQALKN